jgi:hypothetical protein
MQARQGAAGHRVQVGARPLPRRDETAARVLRKAPGSGWVPYASLRICVACLGVGLTCVRIRYAHVHASVLRCNIQVFNKVLLVWPFATRSRMELQFHPAPGSKRSSQLHKVYQSRCTAKNSWWWAERLPETCRVVIPIKLGLGASVGFIHKE